LLETIKSMNFRSCLYFLLNTKAKEPQKPDLIVMIDEGEAIQ